MEIRYGALVESQRNTESNNTSGTEAPIPTNLPSTPGSLTLYKAITHAHIARDGPDGTGEIKFGSLFSSNPSDFAWNCWALGQ